MNILKLLLLLILAPMLLQAQSITGKVYRFDSDSTLAGASVYFGGSVKGTSTNSAGMFSLPASGNKVPLIVSCIGYYSEVVNDYAFDVPVKVYLKPKENMMREVMIGSDGMSREEKLRIFKREFLGTSEYALNCTIVNLKDIDLRYDMDNETLSAFCNEAIIIKNKMLGYTINYYLDNFRRIKGHVIFAGNYRFKEDTIINRGQVKQMKLNREDAYSGSRMQFIRCLWNNTLIKAGYEMYDNRYTALTADSVIKTNNKGDKFVTINRGVRIAYRKNYNYITYLTKKDAFAYIDQNGFHDAGLMWSGLMSKQRIGDMLPFEYVSPQDEKVKPKPKPQP